jgi:hypothetical protein
MPVLDVVKETERDIHAGSKSKIDYIVDAKGQCGSHCRRSCHSIGAAASVTVPEWRVYTDDCSTYARSTDGSMIRRSVSIDAGFSCQMEWMCRIDVMSLYFSSGVDLRPQEATRKRSR